MRSARVSAALRIAALVAMLVEVAHAEQSRVQNTHWPDQGVVVSVSPWRVKPHIPVEVTVSYYWSHGEHAVVEPNPAADFAEQEVLVMDPPRRDSSGGVERCVVHLRVMPPGPGVWRLPTVSFPVELYGTVYAMHSPDVEVLVTDHPRPELPIAALMVPPATIRMSTWIMLGLGVATLVALILFVRARFAHAGPVRTGTPDERFDLLVERAHATLDPRASAAFLALALRGRAGEEWGFDGAAATAREATVASARAGSPAAAEMLGGLLGELDGFRFAAATTSPGRIDTLCARALAWRTMLAAPAVSVQAGGTGTGR